MQPQTAPSGIYASVFRNGAGEHTAHRALRARENRTYRVGPKGGVYYINSHNKKVYIKSRRVQ